MLKSSVTALALGVALVSGSAMAYEAGDLIVRAGAAAVDPQEESSELFLNGDAVPGSSAGVDSDVQLGLSITYMMTENAGFEVLAATPFSHNITAYIPGVGTVDAAEVKHLPPTFSFQFYPLGVGSAFQPYVGVGINYTTFFDEEVSDELNAVTQSLTIPGEASLDLKDSFGYAVEVGCDFAITDHLVLNAAIWKAGIDTVATFSYVDGSEITANVDIDPMVYMVAAGYKF